MASETIFTISPATNQVVFERAGTTIDEARKVAAASRDAFLTWSETPLSERKDIVKRGLALVQERKMKLGEELTQQMGRPIAYSHKEIETMQIRADYLLDTVDDALKEIPGRPQAGFRRWVRKVPVGPTLIIFAWNFPYLIIVNALVPALLAGNTVILKPSPQTPIVAESLLQIFQEAGLPKDVLQIVQSGSPEILDQIVQLPDISAITFTGSTTVGLNLRAATAGRIVPLGLELGGNDPAYVRPDADLAYVAAQLVDGAVFNSGQSCCAVERIYVHADVHDAFVEEVQKELKTYRLGSPFDKSTMVGPVISKQAVKNINAQIDDALAKGATDSTPDNETFRSTPPEGNYVAPRLLTNVTHDMVVMREETFGPVIPVMKVSSDSEAVELMNDSDYGLTASVWTKNSDEGLKLMEKLDAGTVFINRCDYPNADLAWTGWKNSGLGCTLGPRAFDAFFKLKSFHIKEQQA
ncbi:hypothetical protein BP6252_12100 [Coleophoma cylindrospora]|uniref:aldehyde dehydrogenase (NAD(+)) n=1 Tax=Coleophoma cylindrospora TaxID=1849047 RepID=A0A3D8QG54_9HELO|nr:hypothetical protein BP6252_12100 [Coleophoma cylindrospora]